MLNASMKAAHTDSEVDASNKPPFTTLMQKHWYSSRREGAVKLIHDHLEDDLLMDSWIRSSIWMIIS